MKAYPRTLDAALYEPHAGEFRRLTAELDALDQQRCALADKWRAERNRLVDLLWGVRPGCVVKHDDQLFRVLEVHPRTCPDIRPWLVASPKRKDGSFGTARRTIYSDWELA